MSFMTELNLLFDEIWLVRLLYDLYGREVCYVNADALFEVDEAGDVKKLHHTNVDQFFVSPVGIAFTTRAGLRVTVILHNPPMKYELNFKTKCKALCIDETCIYMTLKRDIVKFLHKTTTPIVLYSLRKRYQVDHQLDVQDGHLIAYKPGNVIVINIETLHTTYSIDYFSFYTDGYFYINRYGLLVPTDDIYRHVGGVHIISFHYSDPHKIASSRSIYSSLTLKDVSLPMAVFQGTEGVRHDLYFTTDITSNAELIKIKVGSRHSTPRILLNSQKLCVKGLRNETWLIDLKTMKHKVLDISYTRTHKKFSIH